MLLLLRPSSESWRSSSSLLQKGLQSILRYFSKYIGSPLIATAKPLTMLSLSHILVKRTKKFSRLSRTNYLFSIHTVSNALLAFYLVKGSARQIATNSKTCFTRYASYPNYLPVLVMILSAVFLILIYVEFI